MDSRVVKLGLFQIVFVRISWNWVSGRTSRCSSRRFGALHLLAHFHGLRLLVDVVVNIDKFIEPELTAHPRSLLARLVLETAHTLSLAPNEKQMSIRSLLEWPVFWWSISKEKFDPCLSWRWTVAGCLRRPESTRLSNWDDWSSERAWCTSGW